MISNVFINNSESVISMTKNARAKAVSIGKTAAVVCMVELDAVRNMERIENDEEGENQGLAQIHSTCQGKSKSVL